MQKSIIFITNTRVFCFHLDLKNLKSYIIVFRRILEILDFFKAISQKLLAKKTHSIISVFVARSLTFMFNNQSENAFLKHAQPETLVTSRERYFYGVKIEYI